MPSLRGELFEDLRPGYLSLTRPIAEVKSAIEEHAEFRTFTASAAATFTGWRGRADAACRAFVPGDQPKELIEAISEDLLAAFQSVPLVDPYDVYQHLMDYWAEALQDDSYVIAATGWVAGSQPREIVKRNAGVVAADAPSPRVTRRDEFVSWLAAKSPRLICALIHKFDTTDLSGPPPNVTGRFYVFVDECHRTQGGDMNKQMKRWLEGAIFVGFTGTPLLRKDRQTTREVFGTYIHTYKFQEAVRDKVVLDLKYEARDVPQRMTSPAAIDAWFEKKTKNLNNFQKAVLRKRWANMEELLSATERKRRRGVRHPSGTLPAGGDPLRCLPGARCR
ncbi:MULTISPECIES: hypothetical protein [unclassified Roseovarius]|uniref:hypothetical protein n=1 Tax=unclassified Roseovarius TaxID=2614913 RepID=UPI00273FAC54|nr:hypothetical protein [Roseovarius sp. MMSF_3350]